MKIFFFLVLLFILQTALAQNPIVQVERYILSDKLDSAQIVLKNIEKNNYTQILEKIIDDRANYAELLAFCRHLRVQNTFGYENLDAFLKKRIIIPNQADLNLDYVKLKQFHIQFQANELSLDESITENEKLKTYIEQYKDNPTRLYEIANLYASIHDILMLIIQQNPTQGIKLCNQNIDNSISLKDTLLLINFKLQKLDFLLYAKKLDEFLKTCREILELEERLQVKTAMYGATIDKLIDAWKEPNKPNPMPIW